MAKRKTKEQSVNMGRRDFIHKSTMACCLLNIPFLTKVLPNDESSKMTETDVNSLELVTYCGLYCGACDIYQKRISQSGNDLKKVLDALDFSSFSNQVPGLEDYDAFYKVLNTLITLFGQCPTCQKGGGPPQCPIRDCCREKDYETCAECSSFPCEKVKYIVDSYPPAKDNILQIREIGLEKWSQKEQEKVNKGFRYSDILGKSKS